MEIIQAHIVFLPVINIFFCEGFIVRSMVYFWWYASRIFSSNACCVYSATDLVSSLCDSSFQNSQICNECFEIDHSIDLSNACMASSLRFGVRSLPHFLGIRPLRRFLHNIFDCEETASFRRIILGLRDPGKVGLCHGVFSHSW
jgi:hypothetical protein